MKGCYGNWNKMELKIMYPTGKVFSRVVLCCSDTAFDFLGVCGGLL